MNRLEIPKIGMGTYRLTGGVALKSITDALDLGYRHIDTAAIYHNEAEVGQVIASSGIARDELFITTKVWFDKLGKQNFMPSVNNSLKALNLSHVDLLLIHWPSPGNEFAMEDYLGELLQAKRLGLTRYIGVSNFTVSDLRKALKILGEGEIYTNQIEVHPYLQNNKVVEFCQHNAIKVTGYMPLAVGDVMADETLQTIAENHQVTPAHIAIAWQMAKNIVCIPSSTNKEHLASNLAATTIVLTPDEIDAIEGLECADRIANPSFSPTWD
jgi:2,5-diketo-D-gluconate reductase B